MDKTTNTKKKMFIISLTVNVLLCVIVYFLDLVSWDIILVIFLTGIFCDWTSRMLLYPENSTNSKK